MASEGNCEHLEAGESVSDFSRDSGQQHCFSLNMILSGFREGQGPKEGAVSKRGDGANKRDGGQGVEVGEELSHENGGADEY